MEGKGCLFKKFAGIDVFDIELAETDADALVDTIARMEIPALKLLDAIHRQLAIDHSALRHVDAERRY
jgi:hypothetical protein